MNKLDVLYEGWGEALHLGTLAEHQGQVAFEYSKEALQRALELSPYRYPLRAEAYTKRSADRPRTPGFIDDALPDGWGLLLMDRTLQRAGYDSPALTDLDRLAIVGDDAFGALHFRPSRELAPIYRDIELLDVARASRQVQEDKDTELLPLLCKHGSPHGARPKASVWRMPDGRLTTAVTEGAEPCLVKFPAMNERREVCAIEQVYAELARLAGIEMMPSWYVDLSAIKGSAFVVSRFDRAAGLRVPVQTFAAWLDVNFREAQLAYEQLLVLTRMSTNSREEVDKMFLRCVFNVAMHNRDDHLKNFSLRMSRDGAWRLSPAYDLTYSEGIGGEHTSPVMGKGRNIARADLLGLAKKTGIRPKAATAAIDQVLDAAGQWDSLAAAYPILKTTRSRIGSVIRAHAAKLLG